MAETIDIGCAPYDEQSAQVGSLEYPRQGRAECRAYINQIRRVLGEPPEGVSLLIKSNPHDLGAYLEVVAKVGGVLTQETREIALEYAYRCESESPAHWDDEARAELAVAGYPAVTEA